ncbi:uncharacterized protein N7483_000315 [Penicillium malachiteum]|uniref:uncharacterized protein n=1 Tax=Penicillium malachiteum TaxID=1324776 RepID=UPI0025489C55|nr:uncharacterized protein N7483_000315 [Penicillium malachiteum]KAJ5735190.1 hypothetical protein N7483_000315 [Penicillium malachiteum]
MLADFQVKYAEFWQNPTSASRTWLALLFGVLGCAVWIQHSTDPEKATSAPHDEFFHYRSQCTISMASANCTTPGKYKVEASIIYAGMEYLQSSSSTTGISMLVEMVSWQATMMGYHRDPENYSHISPFGGEMRRRSWLSLSVMDCLVAWQTGLPPVLLKGRGDTIYPRNLLDEDFGPATKRLPPSRSETTDLSNITYMVAVERMLSLANKIAHLPDGQQSPENTTSLQQELDEAWSKVPSTLRSFNTSDNDGSAMVKISTLEITYQRARCILYRPYLASRQDYLSHQIFHFDCVDAASRILDCQIQMYQSAFSQPQYRYQAWFGVSRSICDCLTATMVVYLEIITSIKENELQAHRKSVKLIKSLKSSYDSWMSCPRPSLETVKAAELLGNMLNIIGNLDMSAIRHSELSTIQKEAKEGASLDESQFSYDDYSQAAMWDTFTSLSSFDLIDWVGRFSLSDISSVTNFTNSKPKNLWDQEMQQLNNISTGNTYGRKGFPG